MSSFLPALPPFPPPPRRAPPPRGATSALRGRCRPGPFAARAGPAFRALHAAGPAVSGRPACGCRRDGSGAWSLRATPDPSVRSGFGSWPRELPGRWFRRPGLGARGRDGEGRAEGRGVGESLSRPCLPRRPGSRVLSLGIVKGSALGWPTWGNSTLGSDLTEAWQPSRLQLEESQFYLLL